MENNITSKNFKKVQVIVELDDGKHLLSVTSNELVFETLVNLCKFVVVDESKVCDVPVADIVIEPKGKEI